MVKAYLTYSLDKTFGAIATTLLPNAPTISKGAKAFVLVAANELVHAVCLQTGEVQFSLGQGPDQNLASVTAIEASEASKKAAVGYSNGTIVVFDIFSQTVEQKIDNNSKAICALKFVESGPLELLACAAADNAVRVYDLGAKEQLFQLKGHQAPVLGFAGVRTGSALLTAGRDGILKAWDLSNGTLLSAVVTQKSELTGLIVFELATSQKTVSCVFLTTNDEEILLYNFDSEKMKIEEQSKEIFKRANYRKIVQACFFKGSFFLLDDANSLEIYALLSKEEVGKKFKRKAKREVKDLLPEAEYKERLANYISHVNSFKIQTEVRRFAITSVKTKEALSTEILTFSGKNTIEKWQLSLADAAKPALEKREEDLRFGHSQPIQALALSSSDEFLLSAAADSVLLWEAKTGQLSKRLPLPNCSALCFLPKDRFAVAGSKTGILSLLDLFASETVFSIDLNGHSQTSLSALKEASRISVSDLAVFTAPASKTIEVLVASSNRLCAFYRLAARSGKMGLRQTRSLRLHDEPQKLALFPNGQQFAVSFLDNSIKVFYADSLKERLSLYGHSLPVVDFAISSDGYLLASISNDKTLRVWDSDFGNCRRVINKAHENGVHALKLFPETHYALSAGKDGLVKFWDLDSFELVMVFEHIMGESVRALVVSSIGDFFFAGGVNRVLRKYLQTKEQVFAEETKEKMREEAMMAEELLAGDRALAREVVLRRLENLKSAEQLMDLIDEAELKCGDLQREFEAELILGKKRARPDFKAHQGKNPAEIVLGSLNELNRNSLDSIFAFLHLKHIRLLIFYAAYAAENFLFEPLCLAFLKFAMERHKSSILQSEEMTRVLKRTFSRLLKNMGSGYKRVNFNLAALTLNINELKLLR